MDLTPGACARGALLLLFVADLHQFVPARFDDATPFLGQLSGAHTHPGCGDPGMIICRIGRMFCVVPVRAFPISTTVHFVIYTKKFIFTLIKRKKS